MGLRNKLKNGAWLVFGNGAERLLSLIGRVFTNRFVQLGTAVVMSKLTAMARQATESSPTPPARLVVEEFATQVYGAHIVKGNYRTDIMCDKVEARHYISWLFEEDHISQAERNNLSRELAQANLPELTGKLDFAPRWHRILRPY